MVKVGMVGLGGMGKSIAINIAKAGFEFTVADLREAPLKELKEHGASIADSPCISILTHFVIMKPWHNWKTSL